MDKVNVSIATGLVLIAPGNNQITVKVDYEYIIEELEIRLGECPENVKNVLKQLDREQ